MRPDARPFDFIIIGGYSYALGSAISPTICSPNPMLTGIVMTRRFARKLVPDLPAVTAEAGLVPLFNGFGLNGWAMAESGGFRVVGGAPESFNDTSELGLLWSNRATLASRVLRCEWRVISIYDNCGVFVRFADPESKG